MRWVRHPSLRLHPLVAHLGEDVREGLRLLSAGNPVFAVDDKEGHALDAVLARLRDIRFHVCQVFVGLKGADHIIPVETDLGGEVGQILDAANVTAIDEVRLE